LSSKLGLFARHARHATYVVESLLHFKET